jgi:hypothetical protein
MVGNHAAEKIGRDAADEPADAPRRAMPTAMLRQEPPATGTLASRPSADLTGRKSIKASPQLSSIALNFSHRQPAVNPIRLHRIAAFAIQFSHQCMDFLAWSGGSQAIPGAVFSLKQPIADIEAHGLADRSVSVAGDCTDHRSSKQHRFLRLRNCNSQTLLCPP